MLNIDFDLEGIENNAVEIEVDAEGVQVTLKFILNTYDNYLYLEILDSLKNVILGYTRVLPNIDYFVINPLKTNFDKGLIFVKTNDSAVENDLITPGNINKDYKLFLI